MRKGRTTYATRIAIATAFTIVLVTAGCQPVDTPDVSEPFTGDRQTNIAGVALRSLGIPNRHLKNTSATLLNPEAGKDASVLQGTHTHGEGRLVQYQPSTDNVIYHALPGALGSWSIDARRNGEAYIGTHQTGFLFHMASGASELQRIDVPRPATLSYDWVFSVSEASDGWIYFGTYPEGALLRHDPTTGQIEELGQLIPDTTRAQYVRHLSASFSGKLYAGMGAFPELIEIDLESGDRTRMLPERFKDRSFVYYTGRFRDLLLAVVSPKDRLLFFDPESKEVIREVAPPDGAPGFGRFNGDSFVTVNGKLLLGTADDDRLWLYDYDEDSFSLFAEDVGAPIGLADGGYLFTVNSRSTYSIIDVATGEVVVSRPTMFEGLGMQMHAIAEGPDGDVMGGIYINQGFFRQFLDPDSLFSPGTSVTFGGQIDQLIEVNNKIYLAHYTSARLSVYDPAQRWNPGRGDDANPRVIGSIENEQDRFPTMVAGADGRIYLGSIPKYGKLGGALVAFEPKTETWSTYRNLARDQSILSLVAHPSGLIYGGTGITGGLGSVPSTPEAQLFSWNPETNQKVMEVTAVPGAAQIWGLDLLPDGKLVGTADSVLFVYDPASGVIEDIAPGVPEVIKKIVVADDGWVYGTNEYRLFRFRYDLTQLQVLDEFDGYWDSLVKLRNGRLFVARGAELMEVERKD